jgi:hypothetical protein
MVSDNSLQQYIHEPCVHTRRNKSCIEHVFIGDNSIPNVPFWLPVYRKADLHAVLVTATRDIAAREERMGYYEVFQKFDREEGFQMCGFLIKYVTRALDWSDLTLL